jgi:hypothetical protein
MMYQSPHEKGPTLREAGEVTALDAMSKLLTMPTPDSLGRISTVQLGYYQKEILGAIMYALKQTVKDETLWHVFIQDLAASLNRKGLLSSTNEQLFREWTYSYMRGY